MSDIEACYGAYDAPSASINTLNRQCSSGLTAVAQVRIPVLWKV